MRRVLFPILCFLIAGCNHTEKRLDQIESILWDYPDSALEMLRSDSSHTASYSTKDLARYSLLLSAALDKNYIDVQSDSLICPAVNYYSGRHGRYRYLTNYYHGIALQNMHSYSSAIVAFEKAGNEAKELGDHLYSGLSENHKAIIFGLMGNIPASIESHQKAVDSFEAVSNKSYLHYATLGLAIDYVNNKNLPEARQLINQLEAISSDTNLLYQCRQIEANILAQEGKTPSRVIQLYDSIPEFYLDVIDYGHKAISFQKLEKRDSADFWFQKGYLRADNEAKRATLDFMKSKVEAMRKNYPSAYQMVNHAAHVQDSMTRIRLQESASSAQRNYYSQELQIQQQRAQAKTARYKLNITLLIFIILIVISYFVLSARKREGKYRDMLACLNSNEDALQKLVKDNAGLLGSLLSEKLLFLDKLSSDYCNADSEKAKEAVYKQYKTIVRQLKDSPQLFEDIELSLDRYCNGIMTKFKSQFPDFKRDKLNMVILFFTGIPYKTAELLLKGHSADSLKMAKGRFRNMIIESDATDSQLFLDMLEVKKGGRKPKSTL